VAAFDTAVAVVTAEDAVDTECAVDAVAADRNERLILVVILNL
jgi:hypothetical protein